MRITGFDHIVLCVENPGATVRFYRRVLGVEAREEAKGKWSLFFGTQKISLQNAANPPTLATGTTPGSGNFCLLTDTPMPEVVEHLRSERVEITVGPAERSGATGPIMSVYFRDPDGNLVEISRRL